MEVARAAALVRLALAVAAAALVSLTSPCHGAPQLGYYKGKCGLADVKAVVRGVVTARLARDRAITAVLLRMQFHDCFANVSH